MTSWVQSWWLRTNAFSDFSTPSYPIIPSGEIRSVAPVTQNHLSEPDDHMLENASPLRKLPNTSDGDVSCTAPATHNASFRGSFKTSHVCHRFWNCCKRFGSLLWKCKIHIHIACREKNDRLTAPNVWCFLTFWLRSVLRATAACTFWATQLPKVLRSFGAVTFWLPTS